MNDDVVQEHVCYCIESLWRLPS